MKSGRSWMITVPGIVFWGATRPGVGGRKESSPSKGPDSAIGDGSIPPFAFHLSSFFFLLFADKATTLDVNESTVFLSLSSSVYFDFITYQTCIIVFHINCPAICTPLAFPEKYQQFQPRIWYIINTTFLMANGISIVPHNPLLFPRLH